MRAVFRPIDVWPGRLRGDVDRRAAQFSATYDDTLSLLDRELEHLGVDELVIQLALDDRDIRIDGLPRAHARPAHPGVIVAFDHPTAGALRYATDVFGDSRVWRRDVRSSVLIPGWQNNLRAIALGLEALRKVDRYGIANDGEQYRGWKALGAGIEMPAQTMTVEAAARFIGEHAWGPAVDEQEVLDDPAGAYRDAAKRLHPDAGGDQVLFQRLQEAKRVLDTYGATS